jgi:hypothetical protein
VYPASVIDPDQAIELLHEGGVRLGAAVVGEHDAAGEGDPQLLDSLAQPVQLTRGHYVGNVIVVGDYRDRFAMLGPAHDLRPGRLVLGTYVIAGSLTSL